MSTAVQIAVHPSQFPDWVCRELIESLRVRHINPKFHYDGRRQTQKWLALHEACSPAHTTVDCRAVYEQSFKAAAQFLTGPRVHLIGLGCGGGQKDAQGLRLLVAPDRAITYTAVDVSPALVITAFQAISRVIGRANCRLLVCDLLQADDLAACLFEGVDPSPRLITFFGMIPNFESDRILPLLRGLMCEGDLLLFSANLVLGPDPAVGMKTVLPQYDNELTRDWLMVFLSDLGLNQADGEISFAIEACPSVVGVTRVVADFTFTRPRSVSIDQERFDFTTGENIRLFFSYRYTPLQIRTLLEQHGLAVRQEWIAEAGEEGVFLCVAR